MRGFGKVVISSRVHLHKSTRLRWGCDNGTARPRNRNALLRCVNDDWAASLPAAYAEE